MTAALLEQRWPARGSALRSAQDSATPRDESAQAGTMVDVMGLSDCMGRLSHSGDHVAWLTVCQLASPHLRRVLTHAGADRHACDDVMQDTLLAVRTHAANFRDPGGDSDRAALRWIIGIARNRHRRLRHQALGRRDLGGHAAEELAGQPPEDLLADQELATLVAGSLSCLPGPQRQVIALHYLEGRPVAEIATLLKRPVNTVKVYLHRGRKSLRLHLLQTGLVGAQASAPGPRAGP